MTHRFFGVAPVMSREDQSSLIDAIENKAIADIEERNIRCDEVLLEEFKLVVFRRSHT